jgi:hypothetical protein
MTNTTPRRGGKVKKRRRRPEPPPTPTLPIRITGPLIDRVDALRPSLIPREPFIRQLLSERLDQLEEEE